VAHEIETYEDQAAFVSVRENAWHQLGTVVPDALTAEDALKHAHLSDWNVRKQPIFAEVDGESIAIEDKFATVRNNPFVEGQVDVLGVVGKKYEPIQNEDHADLLNALVDESGAHFETAGSLKGGRQTFITMKLPNHIEVGNVDKVETYIAALNSHDGSKAFQFIVTPVRIVCANTQAAALRSAKSRFSVRHTKNGADGIIAQARETLDMTFKYLDAFQVEAEKMIQTSLDESKFYEIIEQLYTLPNDPSETIRMRTENNRSKLMELFVDSSTNLEIRGTAWAGYQAVTEYLDHFVTTQGKSASEMQKHRAMAVATGTSDDMKANAFRLLSKV
jgi:phage/plasmid-like protein (TIGR03299 family)